MKPARGTALRQHVVRIRFASGVKPGPKADTKLAPRIADVRKFLRTEMSIAEIAVALGACPSSVRNLIRRRNICDMNERQKFISLKKSLARAEQGSPA